MQYTLRNVPSHLDAELRRRARDERRSLNEVALTAMARGVGIVAEKVRHRDLESIAGRWADDPEFEEALRDQDRVDEESWR